jgi:hypothetical protein
LQTWWKEKKAWQNNSIRSSAKSAVYVLWGFTIFWNLISYTPFLGEDNILSEISRKPEAAVVFLFPIVGLVMLGLSIRATRQWKRFGQTPLLMDPFPGCIGGQVGGQVSLRLPYSKAHKFDVTLSCRKSYITGSGKNRRRTESIIWQSEGVAHHERGPHGTRLSFRFDVPEDKPEATPDDQQTYVLWKVNINGALRGADFEREYIIPVFKSEAPVFSSINEGTEHHPLTQSQAEEGVYSVAQIQTVDGGVEAFFPSFQRPVPGISLSLFGALFTAAGLFAGYMGAPLLFPIVFSAVGLGIFFGGIFYLAKSLRVQVNSQGIKARRFLFGYPITTRIIDKDILKSIDIVQTSTMQHGNKTTVVYQVVASSHAGKKAKLAERLTKRTEAERLKEMYEMYLG